MKRSYTYSLLGALLLSALSVSLAMAADEPEYSGFLGDYSQLQPRPDSQLIYNYVYEKPNTDFASYNKFLIEAVTVFPSKDADFKGINAPCASGPSCSCRCAFRRCSICGLTPASVLTSPPTRTTSGSCTMTILHWPHR